MSRPRPVPLLVTLLVAVVPLEGFGTHTAASTWRLPCRRIAAGDYWVQDNASAHDNRYRNRAEGGFRWWLTAGVDTSERLADHHPVQYEHAVNTSSNRSQVRYRGAGTLLHVNGRGATSGCIPVTRWFMRTVVAQLDPARRPVVAIGR